MPYLRRAYTREASFGGYGGGDRRNTMDEQETSFLIVPNAGRRMSLSARGSKNPMVRHKSTEGKQPKGGMIEAIKLKLHSDRDHHSNVAPHSPLLNSKLEGYTEEELAEYRQVFNMFDTDRSGAIGLEELEAAMRNLGLEQTREELDRIIDEVDQRGNHEIDFDEFCDVMRRLYDRKKSWNSVIKECFSVFDRADVDGNGLIDYDEFTYMCKNYMLDEDIN